MKKKVLFAAAEERYDSLMLWIAFKLESLQDKRQPHEGEEGISLSATEIYLHLQKRFPAAMRGCHTGNMGKTLSALGINHIHTRTGNVYRVVKVWRKGEFFLKVTCWKFRQVRMRSYRDANRELTFLRLFERIKNVTSIFARIKDCCCFFILFSSMIRK